MIFFGLVALGLLVALVVISVLLYNNIKHMCVTSDEIAATSKQSQAKLEAALKPIVAAADIHVRTHAKRKNKARTQVKARATTEDEGSAAEPITTTDSRLDSFESGSK